MKKVNLYLDSKYNSTDDVGAYGFYIKCGNYKIPHAQVYSRTTGQRMVMIACLEAINMIARKYGSNTMVLIHSKQKAVIKSLIRGGPKKSGVNPNEDLYYRGCMEMRQVLTTVIERKELDRSGLYIAEEKCGIVFKETPLLVDKKEEEKRKPKPLF